VRGLVRGHRPSGRGGAVRAWWDGLAALPTAEAQERWTAWLRAAEVGPPARFTANGYVVTALQAAVAAIVSTPVPTEGPACLHLQHALRAAVRIGNDTDTVAAIAGAVLGARWGASAVPFAWRRMLHGWPGYRARDLGRLAVLSALGGRNDDLGWPSAPSLRSAYRSKGVAVPLADDPGVVLGDVGALASLDPSTGAVISLCRIGRGDVPGGVEHHESWLIDVEDPALNPNLDFLLEDTAAAIASLRDEGKTVFLHCVHAQRRTPAVAAAYLATTRGLSGREAFARVRELLPGALLNPSFGAALERRWPG
jgi:ADP-ribosyl-[dinitrogen reductase] hydrolase